MLPMVGSAHPTVLILPWWAVPTLRACRLTSTIHPTKPSLQQGFDRFGGGGLQGGFIFQAVILAPESRGFLAIMNTPLPLAGCH